MCSSHFGGLVFRAVTKERRTSEYCSAAEAFLLVSAGNNKTKMVFAPFALPGPLQGLRKSFFVRIFCAFAFIGGA